MAGLHSQEKQELLMFMVYAPSRSRNELFRPCRMLWGFHSIMQVFVSTTGRLCRGVKGSGCWRVLQTKLYNREIMKPLWVLRALLLQIPVLLSTRSSYASVNSDIPMNLREQEVKVLFVLSPRP